MRILGVDPGLRICGYAVIESVAGQDRLVEAGTVRTKLSAPMEMRLDQIAADIASLIEAFAPSIVAIEEVYSHYAHPRTAVLMGHARGVILQTAARASLAVESYSATRIKKSLTGNGRAGKPQMQRTIQTLLGLAQPPEPPDVADAVAVALCCANVVSREQKRLNSVGL